MQPPPPKRNLGLKLVLAAAGILFVFAAAGLFGYGVFRYFDSQRPKEDIRQLARAPLDVGTPDSTPASARPTEGAGTDNKPPQQPDASPSPKPEPKPEPSDRKPAEQPKPVQPDAPAPPKVDQPQPPSPPPPPPQDPPKPKPADNPTPKPVDEPKPADNAKPPDNPRPTDNPAPKPPDSPKTDVPPKPDKGQPNGDERLKPILAALKDKKAAVRQQALDDLGKLGEDARPAVGPICEIVTKDLSPAVRQNALDALDKIYPDLAKEIVVLSVEVDATKNIAAVRAIGGLGEDAQGVAPVLVSHLRAAAVRFPEEFGTVMSEDLRAMAVVAPGDLIAQKALIEMTEFTFVDRFRRDLGQPVRSTAVASLAGLLQRHPEQSKSIAPGLMTAVKSMADVGVRGQAMAVLGAIAESDAELRPQVAATLTPFVKAGDVPAIVAVGKCGRDANSLLPALKQLKLHPLEAVRTAASDAATHIEDATASADQPAPKGATDKPKTGEPAGKPRPATAEDDSLPVDLRSVAARVKSGSAEDRTKAIGELAAMDDKARPASRVLCEAALDSNQSVSRASLDALEKVNPDLKQPIFTLIVDQAAANHEQALAQLATLGEDGKPAAPVVRQEIKRCIEQIGSSPARWGNRILIEVTKKAMDTLPKIAPADPQTAKSLIEAMQFTSPFAPTPFRNEGIQLLGNVAESQEDQRKLIVSPLVNVLKEGAELINGTNNANVILEGITQVDEAGNALLKCGPEGKDALVKTVLPKLKDLKFNASAQVRTTAEALQKKIEEAP